LLLFVIVTECLLISVCICCRWHTSNSASKCWWIYSHICQQF